MNADLWRRVEEVFYGIAAVPAEQRAALLDQQCHDDPELRREVEALLDAHGRAGDFLSPVDLVRQIAEVTPQLPSVPRIGTTIGGYTILAALGAGAMGEVYRARDTRLGREVALKILASHLTHDSSRIARFQSEARAASALNHPNAVTVYETGNDGGTWFIAAELIDGVTLRCRLNEGPVPAKEAISIALQCASSLEAAHAAGIIHRDIKPENIMLRPDGVAKIVDFGLARVLEPCADWIVEATQTGSILGTPRYMSPEQARGEKLDGRSDLFSLGAVLAEMVCGRPAFPGASTAEVFASLLAGEPDIENAGPLRSVLSCALHRDIAARYQSMGEFATALRQLDLRGKGKRSLYRRGLPRLGRLRSRAGMILLAFVAVGVSIFAWSLRPGNPRQPALNIVSLTTFEGPKNYPALAPDGTRIAFSWQPSATDSQHIYVKSVEGGEPRQLTFGTHDDVLPAWAPDGLRIAFCRRPAGQTGYDSRAPIPSGIYVLDIATGGAGRHVADGWGGVSWSADGRKLVVARLAGGVPDSGGLDLLDLDSGQRTAVADGGNDSLPAFSPDGRWIGFKRTFTGTASEVFVIPASGGKPRQLTFDGHAIDGITWTSDSREIVFASPRKRSEGRLWRVSISGGDPRSISAALRSISFPNAGRRGGRLAFTEAWTDSNIHLWTAAGPAPSRGPWKFAAHTAILRSTRAEHSPAISPDGKRIAFVSDRTGNQEIWTAREDGGDPVQLTFFGNDSAGSPRWSPDGQRLAFDVWSAGESNVFTIGADGGAPHRLSPGQFETWMPAWSHDGRFIYFTSRHSGAREIWAMPSSGGAAFQVTRGGAYESRAAPDGRAIYYTKSTSAGCCAMWSIPVGGGPERPVPELEGLIISRSWGITNDGIYFIARENAAQQTVRLFRFATRRITAIARLERDPGWIFPALAMSEDGRRLLTVQTDHEVNDLMMITNFR